MLIMHNIVGLISKEHSMDNRVLASEVLAINVNWVDSPQGDDYWNKWWLYLKKGEYTVMKGTKPRECRVVPYVSQIDMPRELKNALLKDLYQTNQFGDRHVYDYF